MKNYNQEMKTFSLFSRPYLDSYNNCYINAVTINNIPKGPLKHLVKKVQFKPLSYFNASGPCNKINNCGYALMSLSDCGCNNIMNVDEVPDLISYLVSNNYTVDTSITKIFNSADINNQTEKLLFFITYNGI